MNRLQEVAWIGNARILADQLTRLELVVLDQLSHAAPDLLAWAASCRHEQTAGQNARVY